jgi:NhaP-type Na+/H+ or K+/H+ antiporter
MEAILVFAVTLYAAVLVSELAERSWLSTPVLFLVGGFLFGDGGLGVVHPDDPTVVRVTEMALVVTLFTDGMNAGLPELKQSWKLPGRALFLGLPITLVLLALLAHWLLHMSWTSAFLMGTVLTPTDPVFAEAIILNKKLDPSLRGMLNVESGLNDGIALPILLALIYEIRGVKDLLDALGPPILIGIGIGVIVTYVAERLERSRFFAAHERYRPLGSLAIILMVFSLCKLTKANQFLGIFASGSTAISLRPNLSRRFGEFVEELALVLKSAGLFVFGAMMRPSTFLDHGIAPYIYLAFAVFLARPIAMLLSLFGARLSWQSWIAAAWFGPKGFASVLYTLMAIEAGIPDPSTFFDACAVVIAGSIVMHSTSGVPLALWLRRARERVKDESGGRARGSTSGIH